MPLDGDSCSCSKHFPPEISPDRKISTKNGLEKKEDTFHTSDR